MVDTIHSDLIKACKQPGCPVCLLEKRAVTVYLQTTIRETEDHLAFRNDLRGSLGLCREHTRSMLAFSLNHTMSAVLAYHDVMLSIIQQLRKADLQPRPHRKLLPSKKLLKAVSEFETVVQALSPRLPCSVCTMSNKFTSDVLKELSISLRDDQMQKALASSVGLCLSHLRQVFNQVKDLEVCKFLLSISIERFESIRRDLVEEIRQIEGQQVGRSAQTRSETWQKVISTITGEL
jgi:hypothetical protein